MTLEETAQPHEEFLTVGCIQSEQDMRLRQQRANGLFLNGRIVSVTGRMITSTWLAAHQSVPCVGRADLPDGFNTAGSDLFTRRLRTFA
ncbi:hypothetical protein [Caballeronia terrestris]|uniref:hypothetical protein n=1 Tax=Caballeronia terrestris TaxID=1226301 RepID=UPI000A9C2CA6|nr:hypothetical protein [Caballeronia terrestris]